MSRFSKLKKQIDNLFDPVLKMEFCCNAYTMRTKGYARNTVPRFYVKLGKEIIWDYPKDFKDSERCYAYWNSDNGISALIREYIDTPVDELLHKDFSGEYKKFGLRHTDEEGFQKVWNEKSDPDVVVSLTDLFKVADRRIGKKKAMKWTGYAKNLDVYKIVCIRLFGWESMIKREP